MRRAVGPVGVAVLATILASVLVSNRVTAAPAVVAYVSCLVACAAWWLLLGVRPPGGGPRELMRSALAPGSAMPKSYRAKDLVRLENLIASSRGAALDAQAQLRPYLRELACSLLSSRRGVIVDPATDDVATSLGAPGEPLLERRADRLPPITERGPTMDELSGLVEHLETI